MGIRFNPYKLREFTRPSEELTIARDMAKRFAKSKILPRAAEIDDKDAYPRELMKELGSGLGVFRAPYPESSGGTARGMHVFAEVLASLSSASVSVGFDANIHGGLAAAVLARWGTPLQKEKFLNPVLAGDKIAAFALTEPAHGSDASSLLSSVAVGNGKSWQIYGEKSLISNAEVADIFLVFARADGKISCFLVERDEKSMYIRKDDKSGLRGTGTGFISFQHTLIPNGNLVGEIGQGQEMIKDVLKGARIGVAAVALGSQAACLSSSIRHSKERIQSKRPLIEYFAVQEKLAWMAINHQISRLLIYNASVRRDQEEPHDLESSAAKIFSTESALDAAKSSREIFGGYGGNREIEVERHLRDVALLTFTGGSAEAQKRIISEALKNGKMEDFLVPSSIHFGTQLVHVEGYLLDALRAIQREMGRTLSYLRKVSDSALPEVKQRTSNALAELSVNYLSLGLISWYAALLKVEGKDPDAVSDMALAFSKKVVCGRRGFFVSAEEMLRPDPKKMPLESRIAKRLSEDPEGFLLL